VRRARERAAAGSDKVLVSCRNGSNASAVLIRTARKYIAEAGFTRHHVLSTDMAEGCSQQLSRQLDACGGKFRLIEERQNGPMAPRQLTGLSREASQSAQWARSIGYC